jgi:hypothetical protein
VAEGWPRLETGIMNFGISSRLNHFKYEWDVRVVKGRSLLLHGKLLFCGRSVATMYKPGSSSTEFNLTKDLQSAEIRNYTEHN